MLPFPSLLRSILGEEPRLMFSPVHLVFICLLGITLLPISINAQEHISHVNSLISEAKDAYGKAALPSLHTAQGICQKQNCPDTTRGQIYQYLSVACFQGYLDDEAMRYADSAILVFEQSYPTNHPILANAYYNRAVMQSTNKKLDQATIGFIDAIQRIENSPWIDETSRDSIASYWLQETSKVFRNKRDFYQAEKYANRGLAIAQQRWPLLQQIQGDLLRGLGNIRCDQEDFSGAIQYFQRARGIYQQLASPAEIDLLKVDQNIGVAYARTGNFVRAEGHLQRVLKHYKALVQQKPSASNWENLAEAHINLLLVRTHLEAYRSANEHFVTAQTLLLDLYPQEQSSLHAELYYTRAYNLEHQGKRSEALQACQKALMILLPEGVNEDELEVSGKLEYIMKSLALQANIQAQQGEIEAAIQTYQIFSKRISSYRKRELNDWSKYYLVQEVLPVYEDAIELCIKQYEQTGADHFLAQAYAFNTTNKAIVLRESIQQSQARSTSDLPESLLQREEELRQKLVALNEQLFQFSSQHSKRDSLRRVWLATQNEYTLFVQQLEEQFPRYYQFKYAEPKALQTTKLQTKLGPKQALVEYFCGADHWYAFVITPTQFTCHRLEINSDINNQITTYHELLTNGIAEDCEEDFLNLSYLLYQQILAIPAEELANQNIDRLIIVPDGLLHYLAFESLLIRPRSDFRGSTDFLLEQYACSYLYSPYFLLHPILSKNTGKKRDFGGFGMEYDENTLSHLDTVLQKKDPIANILASPCATPDSTRRLGKLFYSDDEVRAIANLLDGDLWLNEQVTKAAFLGHVKDYQILHLALHGSYDLNYPMNSALAFTKTAQDDALLRAWEIYDLDLDCRLITLSACNTNYGKLLPGEGAMTLARAFNYAGVPSVVATLWSVPDYSSSIIMPRFYELLKAGISKDVALQQAKLAYLQNDDLSTPRTRLPEFWGPAIIIGDTSPMTLNVKWWNQPRWIAFAAFILISLFLYFQRR
ncbi:MAG: CHAT domain-containing tetratricopeptide repeat protein [Bacteroidota bacterium]